MTYHDATFAPLGPDALAVIRLSRRDAPSSVTPAGRLARAADRLFGRTRANPLADPRLEALRRFAVLYRRHGERCIDRESAALASSGYSQRQIAHALRLLKPEVLRRRRSRLRLEVGLIVGGGVLLAISTQRALAEVLDSPLIALVVLGLGIATLSPLAVTR